MYSNPAGNEIIATSIGNLQKPISCLAWRLRLSRNLETQWKPTVLMFYFARRPCTALLPEKQWRTKQWKLLEINVPLIVIPCRPRIRPCVLTVSQKTLENHCRTQYIMLHLAQRPSPSIIFSGLAAGPPHVIYGPRQGAQHTTAHRFSKEKYRM